MEKSDQQWKNFLSDFSDHLTSNDVKKLKFQLDVPDGVGEGINDGLELLQYCKRKCMIRKDDNSKLHEFVKLVGRRDLKGFLEKNEKMINEMINNERMNGGELRSPYNRVPQSNLPPAYFPPSHGPIQSSEEIVITDPIPQDPEYKMTSEPRGLCIIINNMFEEGVRIKGTNKTLGKREASDKDREALEYLFGWLKFEVKIYNNVPFNLLKDILTSVRDDKVNVNSDCFVCCILSHGHEDGFYCNDGEPIRFSKVKEYFEGDKCPSLNGKPKLFFVQACQGENYGRVQPMVTDGSVPDVSDEEQYFPDSAGGSGRRLPCTVQDEKEKGCREPVFLPVDADFLFYLASTPGNVSWRSPTDGSWFIQELCEVFKDYAKDKEILKLLREMNDRISKKFHLFPPPRNQTDTQKYASMMPNIYINTLRYELFFRPQISFVEHQNLL